MEYTEITKENSHFITVYRDEIKEIGFKLVGFTHRWHTIFSLRGQLFSYLKQVDNNNLPHLDLWQGVHCSNVWESGIDMIADFNKIGLSGTTIAYECGKWFTKESLAYAASIPSTMLVARNGLNNWGEVGQYLKRVSTQG